MTIAFLELPASERKVYLDEAAARRGLAPVIVEKDFWVCWLLGLLFESSFRDAIVFKGGTSLSKVFGVINRFSEDIDLSLAPAFLGLNEPDEADTLSKGQASKWMERAEAKCAGVVRDTLAPEVASAIEANLSDAEQSRLTFEVDAHSHSPVLLFQYPTTQPPALDYLKRSVKLEFGSLTEQRPTGSHPVRPWIADVLPEAFADWRCNVVALDLHRAFWEKATILHAAHCRWLPRPCRKCTRRSCVPSRSTGRTKPAAQVFARLRRKHAYRVEIARSAVADLEELYLWVVPRAPHQGAKRFNGLERVGSAHDLVTLAGLRAEARKSLDSSAGKPADEVLARLERKYAAWSIERWDDAPGGTRGPLRIPEAAAGSRCGTGEPPSSEPWRRTAIETLVLRIRAWRGGRWIPRSRHRVSRPRLGCVRSGR